MHIYNVQVKGNKEILECNVYGILPSFTKTGNIYKFFLMQCKYNNHNNVLSRETISFLSFLSFQYTREFRKAGGPRCQDSRTNCRPACSSTNTMNVEAVSIFKLQQSTRTAQKTTDTTACRPSRLLLFKQPVSSIQPSNTQSINN